MVRGSKRLSRATAVAFFVAVCAIAVPTTASAAETPPPVVDLGASYSPSGATCRAYSFKVQQAAGDTTRKSVWGQLCYRGSVTAKPVQVLLNGGGYNHTYWDHPYRPDQYSYVKRATNQGYVTLNIDRLGTGQSDRPDPATLDFTVAGFVTHQLVTALRAGSVGGTPFTKVILNGHSMGAAAAQNEAENWQDVNGLILSGIGHNVDPDIQNTVGSKLYPAQFDPKFFGQPAVTGYLTTLPGQRTAAFISPGKYEPAIFGIEEGVLKDTLAPNELVKLAEDSYNPTLTPKIKAPVLFVQGQFDQLWCLRTGNCNTDPTSLSESTFYSPTTSFTRVIIPDAGHSINSSITAPVFYDTTFSWLTSKGLNH
jgi:pimeloyl-ACP methyl ester carboxylesterase